MADNDLIERLRMEAQIHAQEARTANATIAEIYQLCSGGKGEPGNWHGAEPVRALIAERDALAATLRQQAGRVDEGMVERMAAARWEVSRATPWDKVQPEVRQDEIAQMRAALDVAWPTAALAQNTQGEDYSELGNKFVADAVERLRLTLGELTENAGPLGILSLAEVRIRRLHAERARVPDGWKLAMFVLQSGMYAKLPEEERAVCDALVQENPYLAAAPSQRAEVK